tara:strand:- start:348 stop:692 length:345 start_codon:yes stop_codon:yes gene_type:complete
MEGHMQTKIIMTAVLAAALAGCAKQPDAIVPVSIPMDAYTGMSCEKLATELVTEETNLAALSKTQSQAATGDAVGVFLVGVPLASATGGDKEGMIAVSKGKVEAMKAARLKNGC